MKTISLTDKIPRKDKKVIHCHGCFDFLHVGHIRHLQEAKAMGDILIVTVTSDRFVNKGEGRPIFNAYERIEMLAALDCVDYVSINDALHAIMAINILKPDLYVKGQDYVDVTCDEFNAVIANGGRVVFTETKKFSTTQLIEKIRKC